MLQQWLKLVTEAFKRTLALAETLQEVVADALSVTDLANAAFSEILGDYPQAELQWLNLLHQSKSSLVRFVLLLCLLVLFLRMLMLCILVLYMLMQYMPAIRARLTCVCPCCRCLPCVINASICMTA